jgi:hypothetical protein
VRHQRDTGRSPRHDHVVQHARDDCVRRDVRHSSATQPLRNGCLVAGRAGQGQQQKQRFECVNRRQRRVHRARRFSNAGKRRKYMAEKRVGASPVADPDEERCDAAGDQPMILANDSASVV